MTGTLRDNYSCELLCAPFETEKECKAQMALEFDTILHANAFYNAETVVECGSVLISLTGNEVISADCIEIKNFFENDMMSILIEELFY